MVVERKGFGKHGTENQELDGKVVVGGSNLWKSGGGGASETRNFGKEMLVKDAGEGGCRNINKNYNQWTEEVYGVDMPGTRVTPEE